MPTPKGSVPWNAGKGVGWINSRGYRCFSVTRNGKRTQIKAHRKVMEEHLSRKLEPWEVVHHKDGDPLNNDIGNLEVKEFGQHTSDHHAGTRQSYDTRRTIEAFANMRAELASLRAINADLYAALSEMLMAYRFEHGDEFQQNAWRQASAAKSKAEGRP